MTEVTMDRYGYVMGTIPATPGCETAPVIGFIAHVDTSPDMSGKEVKPRIVENYYGGDLVLNGKYPRRKAKRNRTERTIKSVQRLSVGNPNNQLCMD